MLKKSLQLCAEIEAILGQIYRKFEQSPESTPQLKTLWTQMALDEEDHERQVRFALRLPTGEISLDTEAIEDGKIIGLHREIREALDHIEREPLKVEKMLSIAEQLEGRFLAAHVATAASCQNPKLKQLFAALGKHDREHVAQLTEAIAAYRRSTTA